MNIPLPFLIAGGLLLVIVFTMAIFANLEEKT